MTKADLIDEVAKNSELSKKDAEAIVQAVLDSIIESLKGDEQVEAAVRNYETAYRMQASVPELCDISGESEITKKLYGLDSTDNEKAAYARQCLLARRLVERGVRFVEAAPHAFDGAFARRLTHVSVQRARRVTLYIQRLGHAPCTAFGRSEDQRLGQLLLHQVVGK